MKTDPSLDEHTAAHATELFRAFSNTSRVRLGSAHKAGQEVYYCADSMDIVHAFRKGVKHIQDKQEAEAGWWAAGPPIRRPRGE